MLEVGRFQRNFQSKSPIQNSSTESKSFSLFCHYLSSK